MQRFGSLYEKNLGKKAYFSPFLTNYAKLHKNFLMNLESQIENMIILGNTFIDIKLHVYLFNL